MGWREKEGEHDKCEWDTLQKNLKLKILPHLHATHALESSPLLITIMMMTMITCYKHTIQCSTASPPSSQILHCLELKWQANQIDLTVHQVNDIFQFF